MQKLIPAHNYLLKIDSFRCPNHVRKNINNHYKFIKKNDSKLVFSNGKHTVTLWSNRKHNGQYTCYVTHEKNNNYRITQYRLNSDSVYVSIKIFPIELQYLQSYVCITTLQKFLFIIDLYNKDNSKKSNKSYPLIKVFQDSYMVRHISEFL
jgi:hypothetical protein